VTVNGIDVASYQSSDYATKGLDFVVVKATEGSGYVNPKHAGQVATARAHGLVVGHYHFARPGSVNGQADYFLAHAAAKPGDFLALDWEDTGVSNKDKDAWLKHVKAKAAGHQVVLYTNLDFWHRDTTSYCADGLWIADPSAPKGEPRVEHPWLFHQYSSAGGLDRNVGNFASRAALHTWAGASAPAQPRYEPFPGVGWFTVGRKSPIVAAMHARLVAVGCNHYRSTANKDVIGSGDIASYEAWQRRYNTDHHKGWTGSALTWPPGRETWDALHVPKV
jgi:hypothetical protein